MPVYKRKFKKVVLDIAYAYQPADAEGPEVVEIFYALKPDGTDASLDPKLQPTQQLKRVIQKEIAEIERAKRI